MEEKKGKRSFNKLRTEELTEKKSASKERKSARGPRKEERAPRSSRTKEEGKRSLDLNVARNSPKGAVVTLLLNLKF